MQAYSYWGLWKDEGGGSCEIMKSWRENDVAAKKAAKRPKSGKCQLGKCQLGSDPLVRAKRRAEMKNGGMRTRGGSFVPVVQVSLMEIGLRKRKQINVRRRLKHLRRLGQNEYL